MTESIDLPGLEWLVISTGRAIKTWEYFHDYLFGQDYDG